MCSLFLIPHLLSYASDVKVRKRFNRCHCLRLSGLRSNLRGGQRWSHIILGKLEWGATNLRIIGTGVPKIGGGNFFGDTSVSPAELMYDRRLQSHLDTLHPDLSRKAWQTQEQQMWRHGVLMQSLDISK